MTNVLQLVLLLALALTCEAGVSMKGMPSMEKYGAMVLTMQKKSMGVPDPNVGKKVANMKRGNPDEMGSYMEGDMLVPKDTQLSTNNLNFLWPNATVPYRIRRGFSSSDLNMIKDAMRKFEDYTCVRFVPYTTERDYVTFENRYTGCWSSLGRVGGKQIINLQSPGCTSYVGIPLHEMMHALGITHEHSRSDRDSYVNILWNNILPKEKRNFKLTTEYAGLGLQYNYGSVMHYGLDAFSKNYEPTMEAKKFTKFEIGQRKGLSLLDIVNINRLYGCSLKEISKLKKFEKSIKKYQ